MVCNVAGTGLRATDDVRLLLEIAFAVVPTGAVVCDVARAGARTTDRCAGQASVRRTRGARALADLGHVARAGRRAAYGAPRQERVRRTRGPRARAHLGRVADAG